MHFDLTDLRLLVAIAEHGSLSRAAAKFPIALSAASNRLRLFEQRLGLPLFERHADGMQPNAAGRVALDHARRVLAEARRLQEAVEGLAGRRRVRISLAANTVANSTFLPPALGPFLIDYPEVDLAVEERPSREVLKAVRDGEFDIGVLDGNLPLEDIVSLPFRQDRLVLLVPAKHALAARENCPLRDALDYPFVGMPQERAMQRFVEEMAVMLGRPLTVRVRAPSFSAMAQLVAQGVGLSILPDAAARRQAAAMELAVVALDDGWATRELRLIVRNLAALSAQARQLVNHLAGTQG